MSKASRADAYVSDVNETARRAYQEAVLLQREQEQAEKFFERVMEIVAAIMLVFLTVAFLWFIL
jgi:hypothetical protein